MNKVVVFDLDDTLTKERDFLNSAYREISARIDNSDDSLYDQMIAMFDNGENVFEYLSKKYNDWSMEDLLGIYRNHLPSINLFKDASELLECFSQKGYTLGLITDGRSVTQRNKIRALQIEKYFQKIVISEEFGSCKPSAENFMCFNDLPGDKYYVADNPSKDFLAANRLNWTTICLLDDGQNIHKQDFNLPPEFLPTNKVSKLIEIKKLICG